MSKNKLWLGIILSIILLTFSISGIAYDYTYTQQSGSGFFVGTADEADVMENHNELRQVINDLGKLLYHSKMDGAYPKDETTGGTLAIPNSALASFATGTKGDLFYCSAANVWTKLNIGADNKILVVNVDVPNWETASSALLSDVADIGMLDENETITGNWVNTAFPWADNEVADTITCTNYFLKTEINTQLKMETLWGVSLVNDSDLDLYYLKTAINTQTKMETIWATTLCTDTELTAALADYYLKVDIDTQAKMETIWGVSLCTDSELTSALNSYYLKADINTQVKMETIWGVSLANDSELHNAVTLGTANGLSLNVQELSLAINSDTSAGAVTSGAAQVSKVWKTDAAGVPGWRADEGGVAFTFLDAADTPATYAGQGGKFLRVAGAENAIEFIPPPSGTGDVLGPETSANYSIARFYGTDSKTIQDSLAFIDDTGSVNIPAGQFYKINAVALAVGNITGAAASGANTDITSLTGLTTPLEIAYGGTGSVSASGARTALGLAIGTNVQAYDAGLLSLAGLTYASDSFIKVTANDTYAIRTLIETKTDLAYQLSDMSDVGVTTPTDKYVLVADGDSWESRAISSDDLSDVASIGMLDEYETLTKLWTFMDNLFITRTNDTQPPLLNMRRKRDGDPTDNVAENDVLGEYAFAGYHTDDFYSGGMIYIKVDGTPGQGDMPGRMEFWTTPDGSTAPVLRQTIDNAGNIKMGDGAWTNYINVTAGGALTLEGTANIEGVDATELSYLDGVTSDIQTQLDSKKGNNYYSALASDHTYSGELDSQPVGENVVFGQLLYYDWTDVEWKLAKADSTTTVPGLRIALETKANGETCLMLVKGYIRDDSAFDFAGAMIYVSEATAGAMTSTAPSTAGNQLQRVGQAKSADILFFDPSIDVGEI